MLMCGTVRVPGQYEKRLKWILFGCLLPCILSACPDTTHLYFTRDHVCTLCTQFYRIGGSFILPAPPMHNTELFLVCKATLILPKST